MGFIKILAKTYGNYFFTMQGLKVMKKDDNLVVGHCITAIDWGKE